MKKFITILLAVLIALPLVSCKEEQANYEPFYNTSAEEFLIKYNEELKSAHNLESVPATKQKKVKSNDLSSHDAVANGYATTHTLNYYTSAIDENTILTLRTCEDTNLTHMGIDVLIPTNEITKEENQAVNNPYLLNLIKCTDNYTTEEETKQLASEISYNSLSGEKKDFGEINSYINYIISYSQEDDKTTLMHFTLAQKLYPLKSGKRLEHLGDEAFVTCYNSILREPNNNFGEVRQISSVTPTERGSNRLVGGEAILTVNNDYKMSLVLGYSDEYSDNKLIAVAFIIKSNKPFNEEMHDLATNSPYKKAIAAMFNMGYYGSAAEDMIDAFKSKEANDNIRDKSYSIETDPSYSNTEIYVQDRYSKTNGKYEYIFSVFLDN